MYVGSPLPKVPAHRRCTPRLSQNIAPAAYVAFHGRLGLDVFGLLPQQDHWLPWPRLEPFTPGIPPPRLPGPHPVPHRYDMDLDKQVPH